MGAPAPAGVRGRHVSGRFLVAHLSDPHIGADWIGSRDPAEGLAAAVAAVRAMRPAPAAVLVSGDLTDNARDEEYERVRELLAPLDAPVHVLPGNHDDRATLRRHFDVPGSGAEPVQYAIDLGPLRLVVLDTTHPGKDPGGLDGGRLDWLEAALAEAPAQTTLVVMHHPPLLTGIPAWDGVSLAAADRAALEAIVARHPQVRRLVGGHVHRAMTSELAGRPVMAVPSTYVAGLLDFEGDGLELSESEPPGLAWHVLVDGDVVSHVQTLS